MFAQDDTTSMRFGNYEVLNRPDGKPDELGRGGFGRTYRARHTFLGTEVALKVIIDRLAFDEAAKKRFLKEAQEHARVNHPGIARITDFGEAEGTFFYAMELCPDGDLKEYVKKRGPLPPAEALRLIRQTAEALHFAHGAGILHRDIKPSNLLLVSSEQELPQVKLIDFGLVKRIVRNPDETADHDAASQWSPAFASPEQIREHALDERTDIFSLGMTAWFLIAGGGPVEGVNTTEVVQERLAESSYESRLPAALTGQMRAVVARMIEKSTARRYRNCAELLEGLTAALRDAPAASAGGRIEHRKGPLAGRFTLEPAGRVYLGEVFRGLDRERQMKVRVTLVDKDHGEPVIAATAKKVRSLAAAHPPGLVPLLEMTEYAEGWAVVEEECTGQTVAEVLRREGAVPLAKIAPLLWDTATGIDAALECGAAPGALEQALVEGAEKTPVDWSTVQIRVPLHLVTPQDGWDASADMTNDPQQTTPLKAFAGLVYLAAGGRHVRAQAFYSSAAGIAIPGLSSSGNRTLAACLAGETQPEGCCALLRSLFADEGLPGEGIARRAQERRVKSLDEAMRQETRRIERAAATVEALSGHTTVDPADLSLTEPSRAAARAAELTGALASPGAHTEAACYNALQELRTLAGKAESAAATCAERSQKPVTLTVSSRAVPPAAGLTADRQAELLRGIETTARQASESSGHALRVKMPPGADDSALCQHQVEARRAAKEATMASQQARDLAALGKLDAATAAKLTEAAHIAAATVARALDAARRLATDPKAETRGMRAEDNRSAYSPPTPSRPVGPGEAKGREKLAFRLAVPSLGPAPAPVVQEPVVHRQPAIDSGVARPSSSRRTIVILISVLAIAAAGAGGWMLYKKMTAPPKTGPTPPPAATTDDSKKTVVVDPEKTGQPPKKNEPPAVPSPREFVMVFTGDIPDKDEDLTFPGASAAPKANHSSGRLEFAFSLLPGSPVPQPVVDSNRFTVAKRSETKERAEFTLTRVLPPASVRLKGLDKAVNKSALTVGGRQGTFDQSSGTLFFTQAAQADGRFRLDVPSWQVKSEPVEVQPGVWEAEMALNLFPVAFEVSPSAGNSWRSVAFTPVNPGVLPPLKSIDGLSQNASPGDTELTFTLDSDAPEPAPLPAGDYTLTWSSSDVTDPPRDGGRFTVHTDKDNLLPVPAK